MSCPSKVYNSNLLVLTVKTVNIQGGLSVISNFLRKSKKKKLSIGEEKKLKKQKNQENYEKKKKKINKLNTLFLWINNNVNSVIVLTETKATPERAKLFEPLFNERFYVFCNNFYNEEEHLNPTKGRRSKQGTITLIPKSHFSIISNQYLMEGKVTLTSFFNKNLPNKKINLVSYYNPSLKDYPYLFDDTIQKVKSLEHLIIAGDFNQIINYSLDYNRTTGNIKEATKKNKIKKANLFNGKLEILKLNYSRDLPKFTHTKTSNKSSGQSEQNIDWILFTKDLDHIENQFSIHDPSFSTDHKIIEQNFILDINNIKKNNNNSFKILEATYHDPKFFNPLHSSILNTLVKDHLDPGEKLLEITNSTISLAKSFQIKKKKKEKKKINKILKKLAKKEKRNKEEILNELNSQVNTRMKSLWNKKINFSSISGPNKIFSNFIKKNNPSKKRLTHIENNEGSLLTGEEAANFTKDFFQNIYKDEPIDEESIEKLNFNNPISIESKSILEKLFTTDEILVAINTTPNRAPGPSGISITLFKKFKFLLAPLLRDIANIALTEGRTNEFLLKGIISLIPKKENSSKVTDLRPITLLEIARKIITKAMTNRLKSCLISENIIGKQQFCHPDRNINENILTLQLAIKYAKENNHNLHGLFLDFEKAFDRVNHNYIIKVLEKREFPQKYISFIKTFLKGESRINFNGQLSETLKIERGVPQGETISPFLFIIAIDPLLKAIQKDIEIKSSISICKNLKSLGYADDIVLLSKEKQQMEKMIFHVKNYEKASNAKLNVKKSQLISFGNEIIDEIKGIKQNDEGNTIENKIIKENTVRHLGIYLNKDGFINNINDILKEVESILNQFRLMYPIFSVKINLIKGYFFSKLNYSAPFLNITKDQIEVCNNIIKWFLGKTEKNENKIIPYNSDKKYNATISLNRLSFPQNLGGKLLHNIQEIFSAFKTNLTIKMVIELQNQQKKKDCFILLSHFIDIEYEKQDICLQHPIYNTIHKKPIKREWEWLQQAEILYSKINKTIVCKKKEINTTLIYLPKGNQKKITKNNINQIDPKNCYPIQTITIEKTNDKNKITKTTKKIKAPKDTWKSNFSITFDKWCYKKKIKIKEIIFHGKKKYKTKKIPWTKTQLEWIDKDIPLINLLKNKTKNIPKIEDFRTKYLMQLYSYLKTKNCICEKPFSMDHLLNECQITEEFENNTIRYGKTRTFLTREERIKQQFNPRAPNYDYCWIVNWALWLSYIQEIINKPENKFKIFFGCLEEQEYLFIQHNLNKQQNHEKKIDNIKKKITRFRYHSIENIFI